MPRRLTADSVKNIAYPLYGEESARFKDGEWTAPVSWRERVETVRGWWNGDCDSPVGYSAMRDTMALESSLLGSWNGHPAAAVVFWESGGGSGTWKNIALVIEQDDGPACVATADLGDRTRVLGRKFDGDRIVLDVLRKGDGDSCADPTEHVRLTYGWSGKKELDLLATEPLPPVPAVPAPGPGSAAAP